MSKKIKVLMVPSDLHGVGHFRSIWPAQSMQENFSDEFEVDINGMPNFDNVEYFKQFDIVHFHRHLGPYELMKDLFPKLKEAGVTLIMDIDDFWEPPTTHPLYEIVRKENLTEKIIETMRQSDYVTTTTTIFADYIKKYNKNVLIMPNALDMRHPMWKGQLADNSSERCRISWIGGSSHFHDLKLLENSMNQIYSVKELENKFQIIMCGFDIRGTVTEIKPDNSRTTRPIRPEETIWNKFEQIFTKNYGAMATDPNYVNWLKKIKKEDYPNLNDKVYVRRWTLPLTQYGKHYDYCDVCLAPLEQIDYYKTDKGQVIKKPNLFNEVKSELKIIEAGMKKKVLIAQDFGIYKELLENNKTGILVSDNKDGWLKAMKKVILDKDYRNMLAENLHNFVKDKYELKNATIERVKIYKELMNKKLNSTIPVPAQTTTVNV